VTISRRALLRGTLGIAISLIAGWILQTFPFLATIG